MIPLVPPPVLVDVAAACRAVGGRAFAVGGCVRDHLTGQAVKDWDVEVFGVPGDDLHAILRRFGTSRWRSSSCMCWRSS